MKKGLLICLSMAIGISAFARGGNSSQYGYKKAQHSAALRNLSIKVSAHSTIDNGTPFNNLDSRRTVAPLPNTINTTEEIIGYTYYDLQTNNSISNRLVNN